MNEISADNNPSFRTSPGKDTTDKIFILSIIEANKYFGSDNDRKCAPTGYALSQGGYEYKGKEKNYLTAEGKGACPWWLRTPGRDEDSATCVGFEERVFDDGMNVIGFNADYGDPCVRPVMWINVEYY